MIAIMCGLYAQPSWSSFTGVVGTCHCLSGRPDLTHTNAYFTVLLSLTTRSSVLSGDDVCARTHTGFADTSSVFGVGFAPSNAILPVTVAPLASSGVAAPPPA